MVRTWRSWALALSGLVAVTALAGLVFQTVSEARDAARVPRPGRIVDVGGGQGLHVRCIGAAPGPTVVMVAGGGTPAVASYRLQDEIGRFAHVCGYDRPGLGWSAPAARPLTFEHHVDQLEALLQNADVPGPYLFVPESFGSLIVIGYAGRNPQNTAGIVFLDGVDPQLWFSAVGAESGWQADAKRLLVQAAWRLGFVRLAFPALAPAWVDELPPTIRRQLRAVYSRPAAGFDEAIQAYRRSQPGERPRATAGMLGDRPLIAVQHGKASAGVSAAFAGGWAASQKRLVSLSSRGRIVVAEGASHQVAQEAPAHAAAIVKAALNQATVAAAASAPMGRAAGTQRAEPIWAR